MLALLKLGLAGIQVLQLINDLAAAGFKPNGTTGNVFTSTVKDAVMAFQSANIGPNLMPLKIDGQVGPLTRWALDVALGKIAMPTIPAIPAPGNNAKPATVSTAGWNALKVARQELGKGESGSDNHGPDVMKYHAVTGAGAGDSWCASFISFCFHTGNPGHMPYAATAGARDTLAKFKARGWTYTADVNNPPEPGDILVFWRGSKTGWMGHIGIVESYDNGIVTTIEGNKGPFKSVVRRYTYTLGQIDKMLGWGRVP
ncbi:CHAP domain-containing protein [Rhizobium sp. LjRoot254]|uniref:CHAP domain-containing protein n=1 Tax=Rhizobium sp. LjRoot254 TaxID=3342297 RepID=UPI003ECD0874